MEGERGGGWAGQKEGPLVGCNLRFGTKTEKKRSTSYLPQPYWNPRHTGTSRSIRVQPSLAKKKHDRQRIAGISGRPRGFLLLFCFVFDTCKIVSAQESAASEHLPKDRVPIVRLSADNGNWTVFFVRSTRPVISRE